MRRQSLAYVLPPPECHPPAVWQCINDLPSQGLSLLMPQGPEFLRYCQLQTAKAWPATNSIASMFCFLNPSFWHGPYNSWSHYFSGIAPPLPKWLTIHAGREHVSYFYALPLQPNLAPGTSWALENACLIHGTKQNSKKEKREEQAPSWLLRKHKGWDLHLDICQYVWTHNMCALRHIVCVARCPWGQWLLPLKLGQLLSGPH